MHSRNWLGLIAGLAVFGFSLGVGLHFMPAKPLEPLRRGLSLAEARVQAQLPATSPAPPRATRAANSNRHTIIVDVAQSVSPAVVSIGVTKTTYVRQYDPFGGDLFFTPYLISPLKQNFPYLGSGFIIDKQGHVVTNYHVVENSTSIYVTLTDKRTYPAKLLDADRFVDIALLQIQNLKGDEDLPVIAIGDSSDIMIGETVLAIGNPFGPLIADPRPSVSVGVVSAVNRTFNDLQHERIYQDMIQTDAAINPGNSGGPLVNLDRQAIGINTFIFSSSGESASVGFSIPISRVMKTVDEILRYGKVRALRSDFEYVTVTPYLVQALTLDVKFGVLIKSVDVGGPADRAGLQPGDVILAVNDKEMKMAEDLLSMLLAHSVGDQLKLTVVRQGQRRQLDYTLQEAKQP